ncbi:MAG: glycosyltransferase family 39 protein [Candidatus Koribacter versatilis]|uniref:Polyprenol-phosphate-mannose--protein mannosyltransferase n=1 Tax=Candidatus Korobacter versatilis TaxID=658062 RepID=A0A932A628_9BACT|nr:glycosyltransferase family 39 protein [Candidatus Koribacter versatilis]
MSDVAAAQSPALLTRRDRITCLLLFAAAFLVFLPFAGFPIEYNFDEMHYVTAAKLLVPPTANFNWEHPPLAKYLIGLGIALAGDRPLGWRFAGIVFGAISIAGMYVWALAVFHERGLARWVALVTLVNMMVFVLARTAMLDIFLLAFLIWGMAAVSFAWDHRRSAREVRQLLAFAGVMFGLAAACKWVGWVLVIFLVLLWATLRILQRSGATLFRAPEAGAAPNDQPWYSPTFWNGVSWSDAVVYMLFLPIVFYAATFLPFLWLPGLDGTVHDIVRLQHDMAFAQAHIEGSHYYSSDWYQWPFDSRHMWFYFKNIAGSTRAVLLMGNPVVFYPGFAAAIFCAGSWWQRRTRETFLCAVWYWLLLLCFTVIPRKISFFHYYLPAACALGLPLAYVFRHYGGPAIFKRPWGRWAFLAAAAGVFVVFYPVLVGLPLPADFSPR